MNDTMTHVATLAKTLLLEEGSVPSMICLNAEQKERRHALLVPVSVILITETRERAEEFGRMGRQAWKHFQENRIKMTIDSLAFVSEGRFRTLRAPDGTKHADTQKSTHGLEISVMQPEKHGGLVHTSLLYEIIDDGAGNAVDLLAVHGGEPAESLSPLLPAFFAGFLCAKRGLGEKDARQMVKRIVLRYGSMLSEWCDLDA